MRARGRAASRSAPGLGAAGLMSGALAVLALLGAGPTPEAAASGRGPAASAASSTRSASSALPIPPGSSSPEAGASWAARVLRGLADKEYEASRNRVGLQAPNRAHDLRSYFEPWGVRLHERSTPAGRELLVLSLAGVGRGEALAPVGPGEVVAEGTRVEIRRGGLVEWYENSRAGLEQGFRLAERPAGEGALVLELSVARARASRRGEWILFETQTGRQLSYGKLAAFDATGQQLEARLELPEASRLRLVVEDGQAVYPLVIDPVLRATGRARLESDQQDAHLGFSVAGAGDVDGDGYDDVIVGAYLYDAGEVNEGAAFIFLGSDWGIAGRDPGSAAARLESDQAGAEFGISVAGAGDVNGDTYDDVIVGARYYDADETDEGAAFVFLGSASGIADGDPDSAAARLESDQDSALLGASVAGAGDVNGDTYDDVIVGAYLYDADETDEGAAFVFLGSASGIADGDPDSAAARLESDQDYALLGLAVSGAGDVDGDTYDDVIVGAPLYNADQTDEGAAFVFLGSASGIADCVGTSPPRCNPTTAAAQLESDQQGADLGFSVAGAGDVDGDHYDDVIVGADLYDGEQADAGAAFVFRGGASGVADGNPATAAARLLSDQPDSELGWRVAGAGDVDGDGKAEVIVGAPGYAADETGEGAAFVLFLDFVWPAPALSPAARALLVCLLLGFASRALLARRRGVALSTGK